MSKKIGQRSGQSIIGFDKKARSASEDHKEVLEESSNNSGFVRVSLDDITPNTYQPRKAFSAESLHELSESIKRQGILQPILVRENLRVALSSLLVKGAGGHLSWLALTLFPLSLNRHSTKRYRCLPWSRTYSETISTLLKKQRRLGGLGTNLS